MYGHPYVYRVLSDCHWLDGAMAAVDWRSWDTRAGQLKLKWAQVAAVPGLSMQSVPWWDS